MNRAESTRCQRGIRGTHNYESTRWLKPEIPETNSVLCMSTYEGGSGHGVDSERIGSAKRSCDRRVTFLALSMTLTLRASGCRDLDGYSIYRFYGVYETFIGDPLPVNAPESPTTV
jgi:hypothetical protein